MKDVNYEGLGADGRGRAGIPPHNDVSVRECRASIRKSFSLSAIMRGAVVPRGRGLPIVPGRPRGTCGRRLRGVEIRKRMQMRGEMITLASRALPNFAVYWLESPSVACAGALLVKAGSTMPGRSDPGTL